MIDLFGLTGDTAPPKLEVLHRPAATPAGARPLLFVHGAYAGAWCWDEHFLPYFARQGFDSYALSLCGHGDSGGSLHMAGISDYVDDLRRTVARLPSEPVLIGHSMGGMVIQKYLEHHTAPAVALMAPVPSGGLGGSVLRLMTGDPWLFAQISLVHAGARDLVDVPTASRAVFSESLDPALREQYAARMQGESQRAVLDMTLTGLPRRWRMRIPPMLVMGAEDDALFSPAMIRRTAMSYGAEVLILPDMAHAMMLERDWQRAADALLAWLRRQPAVMQQENH